MDIGPKRHLEDRSFFSSMVKRIFGIKQVAFTREA